MTVNIHPDLATSFVKSSPIGTDQPLRNMFLEEVLSGYSEHYANNKFVQLFDSRKFPHVLAEGFDHIKDDPKFRSKIRRTSVLQAAVAAMGADVLENLSSVMKYREERRRVRHEFNPKSTRSFREPLSYQWNEDRFAAEQKRFSLHMTDTTAEILGDIQSDLEMPRHMIAALTVMAAFTKSQRVMHSTLKNWCNNEIEFFERRLEAQLNYRIRSIVPYAL